MQQGEVRDKDKEGNRQTERQILYRDTKRDGNIDTDKKKVTKE